LFSMSKIWVAVFWSAQPQETQEAVTHTRKSLLKSHYMLLVSSAFLALCTLFLSFYPEALIALSKKTAEQLLDPQVYIRAVLGKNY